MKSSCQVTRDHLSSTQHKMAAAIELGQHQNNLSNSVLRPSQHDKGNLPSLNIEMRQRLASDNDDGARNISPPAGNGRWMNNRISMASSGSCSDNTGEASLSPIILAANSKPLMYSQVNITPQYRASAASEDTFGSTHVVERTTDLCTNPCPNQMSINNLHKETDTRKNEDRATGSICRDAASIEQYPDLHRRSSPVERDDGCAEDDPGQHVCSLPHTDPELLPYIHYFGYPAKILMPAARQFLSNHLNQDIQGLARSNYQKNWYGLAECMQKDYGYTQCLERFRDPTAELLRDWQTMAGSTIGKLMEFLLLIDRYDIIEDEAFLAMIRRSVSMYDEEETKQRMKREEQQMLKHADPGSELLTVEDVETGELVRYSAFVCFDESDTDLAMEMIEEIEEKRGLKLCVSARDLLTDQNEQYVTAELIRSRCDRTIVVLSEQFVKRENQMCQFALEVAQSLSPAASRSKIIPIKKDNCNTPTTLIHLTVLNLARCHNRSWQWRRLAAELSRQSSSLCMEERQKLEGVLLPTRSINPDLSSSIRSKRSSEKTPVQGIARWETSSGESSSRESHSDESSVKGSTSRQSSVSAFPSVQSSLGNPSDEKMSLDRTPPSNKTRSNRFAPSSFKKLLSAIKK